MKKCTCGAEKIGSSKHSDWCDVNKKVIIWDRAISKELEEAFKENLANFGVSPIYNPAIGSINWKESVQHYEDLPEDDPVGTVRLVYCDGYDYYKDHDGWKCIDSGSGSGYDDD